MRWKHDLDAVAASDGLHKNNLVPVLAAAVAAA